MVALAAPTRHTCNDQMQALLLGALAAATPTALPGCDGLTVDWLVSQYDVLAGQGFVPTRQELLDRHAHAA